MAVNCAISNLQSSPNGQEVRFQMTINVAAQTQCIVQVSDIPSLKAIANVKGAVFSPMNSDAAAMNGLIYVKIGGAANAALIFFLGNPSVGDEVFSVILFGSNISPF